VGVSFVFLPAAIPCRRGYRKTLSDSAFSKQKARAIQCPALDCEPLRCGPPWVRLTGPSRCRSTTCRRRCALARPSLCLKKTIALAAIRQPPDEVGFRHTSRGCPHRHRLIFYQSPFPFKYSRLTWIAVKGSPSQKSCSTTNHSQPAAWPCSIIVAKSRLPRPTSAISGIFFRGLNL